MPKRTFLPLAAQGLALVLLLTACVTGNPAGYDAGLELARSGDHPAAAASFDRALALNPAFAPAWLARAESRQAMGQTRPALEDFRQASELDPANAAAWTGLARMEEELFLFESAAAHYGKAAELVSATRQGAQRDGPDTAVDKTPDKAVDLYLAQALNLSRTGNHAQAARAYAQAAVLDPQNPWAEGGRAASLALSGRCDQALAAFDRFLILMPGNPDGLLGRGLCRMETGRAEEALADFDALLALAPEPGPDQGDLLFHRARALAALDRVREAVAAFAQVVALDPERAEAVRAEILSPKAVLKLLKQAQDPAKADVERLLPVMECFVGQMLGKDMPGCRQVLNDL